MGEAPYPPNLHPFKTAHSPLHTLIFFHLLYFILIHRCSSHYWGCLPVCSQTPSLFPNFSLSLCSSYPSISCCLFHVCCLFSTVPLLLLFCDAIQSLSLFSHLYSVSFHIHHSHSVCLILSHSPLSFPGTFFHMLVSYFCETHILAVRVD